MEHSSESSEKDKAFSLPQQGSSSFLSRAVRNFLFSGIGTVSSFVIALLFAGLTIRYLGTERAGFLMALTALIGLNAFLGDFGLGTPTVRRVAALNAQGNLSTARAIIGSVFTVSFISGLVIALPIVIFFPKIFVWSKLAVNYQSDAFWATIFTMGSFILTQASNPWRATYSALERYDLISILNTIFGVLSGMFGIAVLMVIPTMTAIVVVRLFLNIVRFFVDAFFMKKFLQGIPLLSWNWKELRPMMNFGGWVYVGSIGQLLLGRANDLILTTFLGSAALPYYAFPQRIYNHIHGALAAQSRFLFPMLSSYGDRTADQVKRLEDQLRWLMALASGAIYTAIVLVGPDLLSRLVNPEFAVKASLPLYLACIQGFFYAQDIVPYYSSWAMGWGKPNSVYELITGGLVALTAALLIPYIGYIGASVAQLWSCISVIIYIMYIHRLINPESHPLSWIRSFASPVAMIGVWLSTTIIAIQFGPSMPFFLYIATFMGAMIGFVALIMVERILFPGDGRMLLLKRVVTFPLQRLASKFALASSNAGS
jgi:O-antigen/teichoic acid export membrane protein